MHKLQGCGDLGVGVASRTRNGGMVLGGRLGAGGVSGKILIFFVFWEMSTNKSKVLLKFFCILIESDI